MHIYTNVPEFGGTFEAKFDELLDRASSITIASAYTSQEALQKYRLNFSKIAKQGGDATLLLGMALFEGLHQSIYDRLVEINSELLSLSPKCRAVRVIWHPRCFHGKIYRVESKNGVVYFAGSSNFSHKGLRDYMEYVTQITNEEAIKETEAYLGWLLDNMQSANISKFISFPIIEKVSLPITRIKPAVEATVKPFKKGTLYVDISLSERIDEQQASNLNAFFGKGRWNRATGEVTPRDWFEVEIIASKKERQNPVYPEGDFLAITDDGQEIKCRTQGDGYKNLRSRDDLKILGKWIKGKLQKSGALKPFEHVTADTLKAYDRDYIRLYKISEGKYVMEF